MGPVIVTVSDLHCNSTIGLCPPRVNLDDGGTYQYNKAQAWTWQRWLEFCGDVKGFVKPPRKKRRPFWLALLGDLVDGDHHQTPQLISRNMADQHRICLMSLDPLLKLNPDHIFVIRGTEVHVGKSGQFETFLADDIGAEPDTADGELRSWFWGRIETEEGVVLDLAHHGTRGRLPWTSVNGAEKLSYIIQNNYWKRGEVPPDIAIRGHVHDFILAGENNQTRVIILPSWQLATAFAYRIDPGNFLPLGGAIIDVDAQRWPVLEDGRKYKIFKRQYDPPRKTAWRPPTKQK